MKRFSALSIACRVVLLGMISVGFASTAPAATSFKVTPTSISFGTQTVGMRSLSQAVTVKNTGTTNITIRNFSLTPFYVFQLEYGYSPRTLLPGQQAQYGIRFVPSGPISYNGQFKVYIAGFSQPSVVSLSGKGISTGAIASVNATSLSYAPLELGSTSSQTLGITNTGTTGMYLNGITIEPPFSLNGIFSPVLIAAGKTYNLVVNFTPSAAVSYTSTMALYFDVVPNKSVSLYGTGVNPTSLAVTTFPTLPSATQGAAYVAYLNSAAGVGQVTWALSPVSTLPQGLSLSDTGVISGTVDPSVAAGTYGFYVKVTDSNVPPTTITVGLHLPVGLPTGAACNNITSYDPNPPNAALIPVTDLGTGTFEGVEGGLYPNGSNVRPPGQESAGLTIAQGITPLDANGNPDPNGLDAMLMIGVSVTRTVMNSFQPMEQADPVLNPKLVLVNGAIDGTTAPDWAKASSGVWQTVLNYYLPYQNVTAKQVVAAYVLMPHPGNGPGKSFPGNMGNQESDLTNIVQNLHTYFPNLQLAYLTSAFYGGYSTVTYPEPYPYEAGFAFESVIADQINGDPNLNYNPSNGPVLAPWLSWGPYIWANGLQPRSDGLTWSCQDLGDDGVHPSSPQGRDKTAGISATFFKTDETTTPWFLNPSARAK
ncbi:MAG TPA: choice-of-anchor D domain-containing protein [Terriglobales bacterium]|nr:choice-of-anchor D domain-containing protein [Terriglobales bacterium]